jgi:hypothetical protein
VKERKFKFAPRRQGFSGISPGLTCYWKELPQNPDHELQTTFLSCHQHFCTVLQLNSLPIYSRNAIIGIKLSYEPKPVSIVEHKGNTIAAGSRKLSPGSEYPFPRRNGRATPKNPYGKAFGRTQRSKAMQYVLY